MRVRVGKRTETVIVFLTSRIPKSQFNVLAIDFDIGNVVLEDSGDIDLNRYQSVCRKKDAYPDRPHGVN